MESTHFKNLKLITPFSTIFDAEVVVRDGKFSNIGKAGSLNASDHNQTIDCSGLTMTPGYIDTHIHGCVGFDFMTATEAEMHIMLDWLAGHGVTGILATLSCAPVDSLRAAIDRIRTTMLSQEPAETKILGVHLEGPFFNIEKRGALLESQILSPDLEVLKKIMENNEDIVKLMTLAPEGDGALELVSWLSDHGVVVSLGHSTANYDQAMDAINNGAKRVAHLYNGMSGFEHRNPGLVGAALTDKRVFAELTLDGIHMHAAAAKVAILAKGFDRIVLITDSMQATGLPDGEYIRPGNRKITVKQGVARVENGSLAGSVLTLDKAVRYAILNLGQAAPAAVSMASVNVVNSLNLTEKIGAVLPGFEANFNLIDNNYDLVDTYIDGVMINQRSS